MYCFVYSLQQVLLGRPWAYEGILGATVGWGLCLAGLGIAGIFVRRRVDYIPWIWKEKKWWVWFWGLVTGTVVLQIVWYLRAV